MTYEDALDFIHGIERFGSKPGLRRVTMLLERLGNPQKKLRFVHVAGTNGKGSTCAMLSNILQEQGLRTGLYISPFVLDFRERIQIDNKMIPKADLAEITAHVKKHWDVMDAEDETPTEFELVVAIAMEYFLREKCDIVVLEVGLGGRFDATNAIDTPLASVITSISLDHTEYLGGTLSQIAFEKCGIIKPGGMTVSYPRQEPEALAVIMQRCQEEGNPLRIPHQVEVLGSSIAGSDIRWNDLDIHIPLPGEHQIWNAMTVLETCSALLDRGVYIENRNIIKGIAATRFPARMEVLRASNPLILLDGAHNLDAAKVLGRALEMLGGRRIHAVIGMQANKDVEGFLSELGPRCTSIACTSLPHYPGALPAEDLADTARLYCTEVTVHDPKGALSVARARCEGDDVMLLCGSLYLGSMLRKLVLDREQRVGTAGAGL